MDRFEGFFHQSHLRSYGRCPRSFYYDQVLHLDREKTTIAAIAGRAAHEAIEFAHLRGVWNPQEVFEVFLREYSGEYDRIKELGRDHYPPYCRHGSARVNA